VTVEIMSMAGWNEFGGDGGGERKTRALLAHGDKRDEGKDRGKGGERGEE
jgi:hypothetical protein